jgi:hypothetical protein
MSPANDVADLTRVSKWRPLTIRDCINVIEKFEFRGGISMWRPKLTGRTATDLGEPGIAINISILVPHNMSDDTRPDMNISTEKTLTLREINRDAYPFVDRVADIVRGLFEHEIAEGIFVDGKQVRNPHRGGE